MCIKVTTKFLKFCWAALTNSCSLNLGKISKAQKGHNSQDKRLMGHTAHLRKQFKSVNIWLSYCWLREKKPIIYLMRIEWFFIWTNYEPSSPRDALCQIWLKLAQWFWRRRFLNFVNVFSLFWSEKLTWAFVSGELNKNQIKIPADMLIYTECQS